MKQLAIVVRSGELARVREALRAAVGLSLRGDRVVVVCAALPAGDAAIDRAVATLRQLGHEVGGDMAAVRSADAVEVWT